MIAERMHSKGDHEGALAAHHCGDRGTRGADRGAALAPAGPRDSQRQKSESQDRFCESLARKFFSATHLADSPTCLQADESLQRYSEVRCAVPL
jgi:hypothetical protein